MRLDAPSLVPLVVLEVGRVPAIIEVSQEHLLAGWWRNQRQMRRKVTACKQSSSSALACFRVFDTALTIKSVRPVLTAKLLHEDALVLPCPQRKGDLGTYVLSRDLMRRNQDRVLANTYSFPEVEDHRHTTDREHLSSQTLQ